MKKKQIFEFVAPMFILLLMLGNGLAVLKQQSAETAATARLPQAHIVIDPGHGGEDGGAVSPRGTVESNINLAIALKLDAIFGLYGVNTTLLRDTDISIYDAGAVTLHEKKVSDIHNRVAKIESLPNATLISIHQNIFSGIKYRGAHVFYGSNALSQPLAAATQETLRANLSPTNLRKAAPISKSVYLMSHITCPAILIECGFLSNPEDDALLQTETYQTKLAATIGGAYLQFQNREGDRENVTQG